MDGCIPSPNSPLMTLFCFHSSLTKQSLYLKPSWPWYTGSHCMSNHARSQNRRYVFTFVPINCVSWSNDLIYSTCRHRRSTFKLATYKFALLGQSYCALIVWKIILETVIHPCNIFNLILIWFDYELCGQEIPLTVLLFCFSFSAAFYFAAHLFMSVAETHSKLNHLDVTHTE